MPPNENHTEARLQADELSGVEGAQQITHFMAYVILLSAGIAACALAVEFLLRARTNATRGVWVSALAAVLVVAGVTVFAPVPVERDVPAAADFTPTTKANASPLIVVDDRTTSQAVLRLADGVLPTLWLMSSVLLLAAILYGQRRLGIERAASRRTTRSLMLRPKCRTARPSPACEACRSNS